MIGTRDKTIRPPKRGPRNGMGPKGGKKPTGGGDPWRDPHGGRWLTVK